MMMAVWGAQRRSNMFSLRRSGRYAQEYHSFKHVNWKRITNTIIS
jgi:hypothetical protein